MTSCLYYKETLYLPGTVSVESRRDKSVPPCASSTARPSSTRRSPSASGGIWRRKWTRTPQKCYFCPGWDCRPFSGQLTRCLIATITPAQTGKNHFNAFLFYEVWMIEFATSQLSLKLGILASFFYEIQNCSASFFTYGNHLTLLARLGSNGKIQYLKLHILICV